MFGCFRRLTSLVILAVVAVAAFATRDLWLPRLRAVLGASAPAGAGSGAPPSDAPASPADTGWSPFASTSAAAARKRVARLTAPRGPAYVRLSGREFAALLLDSLSAQLPPSADSVEVRVAGNELQLRASVRLGDIGGRKALGPLAAMVGDRERLVLGGSLEPGTQPGVVLFRLSRVRIGEFAVPGPVVPRLVQAIKRGPATPGVDPAALPSRLPAGIGDARVANGMITLYRAAP